VYSAGAGGTRDAYQINNWALLCAYRRH